MVNSSNDDELEFESRTKKKQYAHSMVDLARKLCQLKPKVLNALPLDDSLLIAIGNEKKITSNIAKKRHFQYMGKLLLNSNHQEIIENLETQVQKQESGKLRIPFITHWQDSLMNDDSIISELYAIYDHSDIQTLRQLLRTAKKSNKQKEKSMKKLFEYLQELDNSSPLPIV